MSFLLLFSFFFILYRYLYLLKLSSLLLLSWNTLELHSSPRIYFFRAFILLIFPCSFKQYFNSSSDISGHSSLVTKMLMFFWHDFIRCSFDPHVFVSWSCFSSTRFLYLLSFSCVLLFRLFFASCFYIHLLDIVLGFFSESLLPFLLVLLLLSKPFPYCIFSHVYLVFPHTFYFPIFSSFFLSLCSIIWFLFRSTI